MGTYHSNNENKYIINIDNWIINNVKYTIYNNSLTTGGTYKHPIADYEYNLSEGNVILQNEEQYKQILLVYTNI
jgi:hypothetical protein